MARSRTRILFACYGGGHVQSLIPVIRALEDRPDVDLRVIGFTTALAALRRAGIDALGYRALLGDDDGPWLEQAGRYVERPLHPEVSETDSLAYYAIGLRDLHIEHGAAAAAELYAREGRKCFLPLHAMRRYLSRHPADLVVTTTSPRSELALLRAARGLGIETLAVSDLFLQYESSYICAPGYASNVSVMAEAVGRYLLAEGFSDGTLHVTGSPAFDALFDATLPTRAASLRQSLGLAPDQRLLLWACPSASVSMIGKPFVEPARMIAFLERYCATSSDVAYLVRQHPNKPVVPASAALVRGQICPAGVPIEVCLHAADQVILETSTVGLQAALLGKPVVTVGAGGYPPYAEYGLARDVASLDEAGPALDARRPPDLERLAYPADVPATRRVEDLVVRLAGLAPTERAAS